MKDLFEVLRQKEMDIARVRREIEALHQVIPLLAEEGDRVMRRGKTGASPLPEGPRATHLTGEPGDQYMR